MSNDPSSALPQRSGTFRAVVQAGSTVTSYLRAGAGRPVVVLSRTAPDHAPTSALIETLRTAFRVMVPQLALEPAASMEWLAAFLDGLGLHQVGIIVDQALAPELLGFAREEPQRVDRIVILADAGGTHPTWDGVTRPVLLVADDADRVDTISWFLAGAPERLDPSAE